MPIQIQKGPKLHEGVLVVALQYQISLEKIGFFVVRLWGEAHRSEVEACIREVFAHHRRRDDRNVLIDAREVITNRLKAQDIHSISAVTASVAGKICNSRRAVVVSTELAFGLARMYEQLIEMKSSMRYMVFTCIEEAMEWISPEPT